MQRHRRDSATSHAGVVLVDGHLLCREAGSARCDGLRTAEVHSVECRRGIARCAAARAQVVGRTRLHATGAEQRQRIGNVALELKRNQALAAGVGNRVVVA